MNQHGCNHFDAENKQTGVSGVAIFASALNHLESFLEHNQCFDLIKFSLTT
jgi:hypothetical protein